MSSLNNLAITATNGAVTAAMGAAFNTLQSKIANGGRDRNCKFYYNDGAGGSILQVALKGAVGGAVSELRDMAQNAFNSLLNGKRVKDTEGLAWVSDIAEQQGMDKLYGSMEVDGGVVYALDDWGCISTDAIMLAIKLDPNKPISVTQVFPDFNTNAGRKPGESAKSIVNQFKTTTLVWFDTTALITINSDKNLVVTRVAGRDYSRKELVSNGDIRFSVSGQITSGKPDIYPTQEMKKFQKVMQYKGVVEVKNQVLNEMGITHIVIENFNISPKQGYKALQQYSFSAIGLQPEFETKITEDTVTIRPQSLGKEVKDDGEWMKMLNNQLDGLKSMAADLFSQGTALASGLLENSL